MNSKDLKMSSRVGKISTVAGSGCGRLNEPGTVFFSICDLLIKWWSMATSSLQTTSLPTNLIRIFWTFFQGLCSYSIISLLKGLSTFNIYLFKKCKGIRLLWTLEQLEKKLYRKGYTFVYLPTYRGSSQSWIPIHKLRKDNSICYKIIGL